MPRKSEIGQIDISETGNWNVAADYSKFKIMRWLYFADEYEFIAEFGAIDLNEEFLLPPELKSKIRVKAIFRLLKTMKILINNVLFAVKKKDKEEMEGYLKDLELISKIIDSTFAEKKNFNSSKKLISINEKTFKKVLDMLIEIKTGINTPLNNADLIFTGSDNIDPDELKKKIMEDIIFSG